MKTRNSNIEIKKAELPGFFEGIENVLIYGAKKYGPSEQVPDKEVTDYLEELCPGFVPGTMIKYIMRWQAQHREEDLLKIAAYCAILWIKYFTGDVREENLKVSKEARNTK